ncbi:MAG: 50S ribosome-binding GTPase [bacterium]|nr:50S ribosome-binding GTPase [bacterium]
MIDLVKLQVIAAAGGHGRVSFRREKYIPKGGPDGGTGGDGGSVRIRANSHLSTLHHLAGVPEILATKGEPGGSRLKTGSKGQDVTIEVPLGTVIWLLAENEISARRRKYVPINTPLNRGDIDFKKFYLEKEGQAITPEEPQAWLTPDPDQSLTVEELQAAHLPGHQNSRRAEDDESRALDLSKKDFKSWPKVELIQLLEDGQVVLIAQGGFAGRGNNTFKAADKTTPLEAEYGTQGERKLIVLELKLLADVGLVGFPNAGKSTLLSRVTKATPRIANYPFTTLEPHLGLLSLGSTGERREVVLADVPGLIEDAHQGKGLGYTFLRHLEHCKALLFILALDDSVAADPTIPTDEKAAQLWQQYGVLLKELAEYSDQFKTKKSLVSLNKIDLYSKDEITTIVQYFDDKKTTLHPFSNATSEGLLELQSHLAKSL